MLTFVAKRLGSLVVVLFFLTLLVFTLGKVADSDPVRTYVGVNASAEAVEAAREELGLDDSIPVQFGNFVAGAVQGDFGISLASKRPIADELSTRLPATLELAGWALALTVVIGVSLSALYSRPGKFGAFMRFVFFSAASAPSFLIAMLSVLVFYKWLDGALPAAGRSSYGPYDDGTGFYVLDGILHGSPTYTGDAIAHLILPALAASVGSGVALARVLADGISSSLTSPWARTARSLGEREGTVLRRHALRNASSPALSLLAVQAGFMVSSLVVVEQVFSWNGLGSYLSGAIGVGDFPAIAAVCLILGAVYVILNTLVDVALAAVDPRVRLT
ncbi:ABC transporter permease [Demequina sp. NBRC 110055]|uniref:ABC transporter permease n=1 Tax=Demequina sp. NBRC 110055 TaxID=1570344 RepID=UPI000A04D03B|nr:ABC transporter permease [Demequina sp. NBRC 110055]